MKRKVTHAKTLGGLLDLMTEAYGLREALVFGSQRLSYRELEERSSAVAAGFLARGLARGDRVAILMGNRPEWVFTYFACAKLGAVLVPISTWSTREELRWTLSHSEADWLILTDQFAGNNFVAMLLEICPDLSSRPLGRWNCKALPRLKQIVFLGHAQLPGSLPFAELLVPPTEKAKHEVSWAQRNVSEEDVASIVYTSGSTARPKGSVLVHRGIATNSFNIGERQHLTQADRLWLAVSLFWSFGCCNALPAAMSHGACVVLQESFDPEKAVELIEREECTVFYGMANMATGLVEARKKTHRDISSLRTGVAIGTPQEIQFIIKELGVKNLCNVYGSTETYGNCCVTECDDPLEIRLLTQGKPLPGMDISIKDTGSREHLPACGVGQICVRGMVFKGYHDDPVTTSASFDSEGFFLTGDLGFFDKDGRLHYQGRIKDMIKSGGLNVSPLEVEQVIMSHPGVNLACVVGIPDAALGEIGVAFVSLNPGLTCSEQEIRSYCRQELSSYKVPRRVFFIEQDYFPRTSTGKVRKEELRKQAQRLALVSMGSDHGR